MEDLLGKEKLPNNLFMCACVYLYKDISMELFPKKLFIIALN